MRARHNQIRQFFIRLDTLRPANRFFRYRLEPNGAFNGSDMNIPLRKGNFIMSLTEQLVYKKPDTGFRHQHIVDRVQNRSLKTSALSPKSVNSTSGLG